MVTLIDDERKQMKKLLIGFMLMVIAGRTSLAQTNFYTNVTNLWYQGGESKTNVLTIANDRLAANTNDFAGLILKAYYHVEFAEINMVSNAFLRVVQIGNTITTTNFVDRWQESSRNILFFLEFMAEEPLTPQEIQEIEAERYKAFIPEKPFPDADLLEALQMDGYFD